MQYELTSDKKALFVINENNGKIAIPVDQIQKNIEQLTAQKRQQVQRYDAEIAKWQEYQKQVDALSKKK